MKKLAIIMAALMQIPLAYAYTECVPAQTNSTVTDINTQNDPTILINEVSFKDSVSDFVELYVKNDKNTGSGTNIKGFEISSNDGSIQKFETDTIVKTGDFILYNATNGLVATNNIVKITSPDNKILDAVCFSNGTPTEAQQQKFDELIASNAWSSSCVDGNNIKENSSIGRNLISEDTNLLQDWKEFLHKTPSAINEIINNPPIAKITLQQGNVTGSIPLSINVTASESYDPDNDSLTYSWNFGDNETYLSENPPNHSYQTAGTYTITLTVTDPFGSQNSEILTITAQAQQSSENSNETTSNQNTTTQQPAIIINEFMPDPEGTDTNNEWIELKNTSSEQTDIQGYKLDDAEGGSSEYIFPSTILQPNETKAFYSNTTKIVLNNDTDRVRLSDPNGTIIDEILYEKPESGKSFAQNSSAQWSLTTIPTPNAENQFPENTETSLTCTKIAQTNGVSGSMPNTNTNPPDQNPQIQLSNEQMPDIEINEIFPNPKGVDTNKEWIELVNNSDETADISGWSMQTSNQKRKYTFKTTKIKPSGHIAISSKESRLTLKNSNDKITLVNPFGDIVDEIQYEKTLEDMSYAKINDGKEQSWQWTSDTTKGSKNPSYEIFNIKVLSQEEGKNVFTALKGNEKITINYSENEIPQILASSILKPEKIFSVKAKQTSETKYELKQIDENPILAKMSENKNDLNDAKNINTNQKNDSNIYLIIAIFIAGALIIALLIFVAHSVKNLGIFHSVYIKQGHENGQNERAIQDAGKAEC